MMSKFIISQEAIDETKKMDNESVMDKLHKNILDQCSRSYHEGSLNTLKMVIPLVKDEKLVKELIEFRRKIQNNMDKIKEDKLD